MKYAIYRDYGCAWRLATQPVRRNGEILTFKKKKLAKQWIKDELAKGVKPSTSERCKWVVRRYIKSF